MWVPHVAVDTKGSDQEDLINISNHSRSRVDERILRRDHRGAPGRGEADHKDRLTLWFQKSFHNLSKSDATLRTVSQAQAVESISDLQAFTIHRIS